MGGTWWEAKADEGEIRASSPGREGETEGKGDCEGKGEYEGTLTDRKRSGEEKRRRSVGD